MKELNDIVTAKIGEMINSGAIEAIINKNLEQTITTSIESAMKSYGDFGKTITDKIKQAIEPAGKNLELPEYNVFIADIIKRKFTQSLRDEAGAHMASLIDNILKPLKKTEKISVLLDEIRETWGDAAREAGKHEIQIKTEETDNAIHINIIHPEFDSDHIRLTLYNFKSTPGDTWHIGYIKEDDLVYSRSPKNRAHTYTSDLSDLLYRYYAMQTEFELDTEIYSIDVCD